MIRTVTKYCFSARNLQLAFEIGLVSTFFLVGCAGDRAAGDQFQTGIKQLRREIYKDEAPLRNADIFLKSDDWKMLTISNVKKSTNYPKTSFPPSELDQRISGVATRKNL